MSSRKCRCASTHLFPYPHLLQGQDVRVTRQCRSHRHLDGDSMTELTAGIGDNSTALDNVDRLAELAHEIKARSDRIEQRTRKTAEEMIEAGKLLLEAKELVKHGACPAVALVLADQRPPVVE